MNPKLFRALPLLALGLWGCSDEPTLVIEVEHPTLIEVNPTAFLGNVPCLAGEGSMQRYVATITDVTVDEETGTTENFTLPSSGPVSCNVAVGFSFVVPGHSYSAEVDGYDRADLEPLGGQGSGARVMIDPETGETVTPRWTTRCGHEPGTAVLAVEEFVRDVGGCARLTDAMPAGGETTVRVGLENALGSLDCGSAAGDVATFQVGGAGLAPVSASCGEQVELAGLAAGVPAELEVQAFEEGATAPTWGAVCSVIPIAGVVVTAECAALSDRGGVEIDLPSLLAGASLACDEGLRELSVTAGEDVAVQRITPPGCERALRLGDLPPGALSLEVTTTLADGTPGPSATCSASVLPGLVVGTSCQQNP